MEETSSGVRQILGEALDKIRDREERVRNVVERVQPELSEAQRAIKALEKILGPTLPARAAKHPAQPGEDGAGRSPRAAFTAKVIALLKDGGRTAEGVAHYFGSTQKYVEGILSNAVDRGELIVGDDGRTFSVLEVA